MWHDEEAKMGLSFICLLQILCTSCFILMVMCKESSKPSKLSTKLSTIWQINDYLSKKIDNRLIVDIIDTRGHPDCKKPWKNLKQKPRENLEKNKRPGKNKRPSKKEP